MTLEEAYQMGYRCASIIKPDIVRCKDCKFSRKSASAYADLYCELLEKCVSNDWFCADGEQ